MPRWVRWHGNVSAIVVMYSINVFLTFSLSMLGMLQHWLCRRAEEQWRRQAALFAVCLLLCVSILTVTVLEKLTKGGWMTVVVTGALVGLAFIVRQHYGTVYAKISELYQEDMLELAHVPTREEEAIGPLDPKPANRHPLGQLVQRLGYPHHAQYLPHVSGLL